MSPSPLRMAFVQQPMAWTTAQNLEHIRASLASGAERIDPRAEHAASTGLGATPLPA